MDKFCIDEEEEKNINPIFIPSLPKYHMEKGTILRTLPPFKIRCTVSKKRKGVFSYFLSSAIKAQRLLVLEDEFIYGLDYHFEEYLVKEIWFLRRLYKVDVDSQKNQIILYFIDKSLSPAMPLKPKIIFTGHIALFLQKLKSQLNDLNIYLEF